MESLEGVMKLNGKSHSGDPRMWYFDSTIDSECWGGLPHIFSIPKHLKPRQHIKKQRYYFAIKGPSSQAVVFLLVMYGCESWTIKKAECLRIDAFKLWCWRRLSKSPLDSKIKPVNPKGNQPWIFIGRTDAKSPVLWPPDTKSWLTGKDSCWERLRLGGEGGDRGWDSWMASSTQWTWVWTNSGK